MRWIRHLTCSNRDEKLSRLMDAVGLQGYGFYWMLVEVMADEIREDRAFVTIHSFREWASLLHCSVQTFERLIEQLETCELVAISRGKDALVIELLDPPEIREFIANNRPPVSIWMAIRRRIFGRDQRTCRYCGRKDGSLECDHVIPVSRGGGHEDNNLATACLPCNRSKKDKLLSEWAGPNGA
jgi:hypothetical protein